MNRDVIKMSVPMLPEYLIVVRLTAAGIAGRMGFNVEEVEDIKSAVAEGCIMLMNQPWNPECIELIFYVCEEQLEVVAEAEGARLERPQSEEDDNELSRYLLQALMDEVNVQSNEGFINRIDMTKCPS